MDWFGRQLCSCCLRLIAARWPKIDAPRTTLALTVRFVYINDVDVESTIQPHSTPVVSSSTCRRAARLRRTAAAAHQINRVLCVRLARVNERKLQLNESLATVAWRL